MKTKYVRRPKTSVNIVKLKTGWALTIVVTQNRKTEYKTYTFDKLIDAMLGASILKLHISNSDDLPLNQYKKAA